MLIGSENNSWFWLVDLIFESAQFWLVDNIYRYPNLHNRQKFQPQYKKAMEITGWNFCAKKVKSRGQRGIWNTGHLNYLKELFNWTSWCSCVGHYQMRRRYHHRHLRKLPFVGLRILRLDLLLSRTLWLCSSHFHSYHMDI